MLMMDYLFSLLGVCSAGSKTRNFYTSFTSKFVQMDREPCIHVRTVTPLNVKLVLNVKSAAKC